VANGAAEIAERLQALSTAWKESSLSDGRQVLLHGSVHYSDRIMLGRFRRYKHHFVGTGIR
jgi:hypothetical protein